MAQEFNRPDRKLTHFHSRELLYDYVVGDLDEQRKVALSRSLQSDKVLAAELNSLEQARLYAQKLGTSHLSRQFMEGVLSVQPAHVRILERLAWEKLPEGVKTTLEAVAIAIVVAAVGIAIPWDQVRSLLQPRSGTPVVGLYEPPKETAPAVTPPPVEEKSEEKVEVAPVAAAPPQLEEAKTATAPKAEPAAEVVATAPVAPGTSLEETEAEPVPVSTVGLKKKSVALGEKQQLKGELYRAEIVVDDINYVSTSITEKIISLGGKKAGQVELGWKKRDGSYYHFTISQTEYDQLLNHVKSFGSVKINKEPHWRVMPEGELRMILWVEDGRFKEK